MSREKAHTSIYDGDYELSQLVDHEPSEIKPIRSRVLIRDAHQDEQIGSVILPPATAGRGCVAGKDSPDQKRIGIVVAVGPGDKYIEMGIGAWGELVVKGLAAGVAHLPMEVKPGDKVLYDRRREAEFYMEGVRYSLVYEEQSVLGVFEE